MKKRSQQKIKSPVYFKVCIVVFLVAVSAQLFLANLFAVKSADLRSMHDAKQGLQKEVARLEFEDSVLSSIVSVEERAKVLGFTQNTDSIYSLNITLPVSLASASTL